MTSDDLADYLEEFLYDCQDRILGVGRDQYDQGDTQKFETMTRTQLIREMQDELRDVAVYAVMNTYRLEKMLECVEELESPNVKTRSENFGDPDLTAEGRNHVYYLSPKVTADNRFVAPDGEMFETIEEYDEHMNLREVRF